MSVSDATPLEVAKAASISARSIATLSSQARNDALTAIHGALSNAKDAIMAANARDLETAVKSAADGTLKQSVLKRLDLSRPGKWEDMLQGILDVRGLEDPGEHYMNIKNRTYILIASTWTRLKTGVIQSCISCDSLKW